MGRTLNALATAPLGAAGCCRYRPCECRVRRRSFAFDRDAHRGAVARYFHCVMLVGLVPGAIGGAVLGAQLAGASGAPPGRGGGPSAWVVASGAGIMALLAGCWPQRNPLALGPTGAARAQPMLRAGCARVLLLSGFPQNESAQLFHVGILLEEMDGAVRADGEETALVRSAQLGQRFVRVIRQVLRLCPGDPLLRFHDQDRVGVGAAEEVLSRQGAPFGAFEKCSFPRKHLIRSRVQLRGRSQKGRRQVNA